MFFYAGFCCILLKYLLYFHHSESEEEVLVVPEFKGLWEADQSEVMQLSLISFPLVVAGKTMMHCFLNLLSLYTVSF